MEKSKTGASASQRTVFMHTIALTFLLVGFLLLGQPAQLRAGCGCDKPPPEPAAVIPSAAFAGMFVTFFHPGFQGGQRWTVVFRNGGASAQVIAEVVLKRDLTDPPDPQSPPTYQPQLAVPVPNLTMGPTAIEAFTDNDSFIVPRESFTVIGQPVVVSEQTGKYSVKDYMTGVGADGTLYVSLGGLDAVCQPMAFRALAKDYPLRYADGAVVLLNSQGFFIDAFDQQSADHFWIEPRDEQTSDSLDYFRHSFEQYCADHQPGGVKEVDPQDP